MNHPLHQFIPNHKIRRTCIFVDQKYRRPGFHALYDIRCLGRASAGILCIKSDRILPVWQIIDKQGNIYIADGSAVLCSQLDSRVICNDKFSAVSCNVVVNSHLQSFQQSGLSVISTAHDQRDSFRYRHSRDLPFMGKGKGLLHCSRRGKRNTVL